MPLLFSIKSFPSINGFVSGQAMAELKHAGMFCNGDRVYVCTTKRSVKFALPVVFTNLVETYTTAIDMDINILIT